MNKAEFIAELADMLDKPKAEATRFVGAFVDTLQSALQAGHEVTLPDLGAFSVVEKAARMGRHPRTGEPLQIGPSKNIKFKAYKKFKEAIDDRKNS